MISIIIPVYQAKQNIEQILGDIFAQTYQDYEVLLIDDGSTDGSAKLCGEYERQSPKVRTIIKEHSGVSKTRNAGIAAARGEYIAFVDSDDRIDTDYLERLAQGIGDRDLVIASFDRKFYKDGKLVKTVECRMFDAAVEVPRELGGYFSALYTSTLIGVVYCKLFRRELIEKGRIAFRGDICLGEDFLFNFEYLRECRTISCIPYRGYHYICGNGASLTHKNDIQKLQYGKVLFEESLRFCEEMHFGSEASAGVCSLYLRTCFLNMEILYRMKEHIPQKEKREFIRKVIGDEDTRLAIKRCRPDTREFQIYRRILRLGSPTVAGMFTWARFAYKKMIGRA